MIGVLVLGIGVIGSCFAYYFYSFWKKYAKVQKLKEYMESDEYKEKMELLEQNSDVGNVDDERSTNMYR